MKAKKFARRMSNLKEQATNYYRELKGGKRFYIKLDVKKLEGVFKTDKYPLQLESFFADACKRKSSINLMKNAYDIKLLEIIIALEKSYYEENANRGSVTPFKVIYTTHIREGNGLWEWETVSKHRLAYEFLERFPRFKCTDLSLDWVYKRREQIESYLRESEDDYIFWNVIIDEVRPLLISGKVDTHGRLLEVEEEEAPRQNPPANGAPPPDLGQAAQNMFRGEAMTPATPIIDVESPNPQVQFTEAEMSELMSAVAISGKNQ